VARDGAVPAEAKAVLPRVAAVMVTYNRRDTVLASLAKLLTAAVPPDEVIVVDNGSTDGTVDAIRAAHPRVRIEQMRENTGPAGGFATGMGAAAQLDCDWIMVLNDDSFVAPATLGLLRAAAAGAADAVGIVAPALRGNGRSPQIIRWHHLPVIVAAPSSALSGRPVDADLALFNAALVRADLVRRFGVPRADYFMAWWEWEYCLRLRQHGYGVLAIPGVETEHLTLGAPSRSSPPWRGYYQTRNHLRFVLEQRDAVGGIYWLFRQVKYAVGAVLFLDQKWVRLQFRLRGAADALRGRMGRTVVPDRTTIGVRRRTAAGDRFLRQ
jgi:hypothetical protein